MFESQHFTTPLICSDTDFNTALEMVKILVQHAAKVFDTLPPEFVRQDYLATAKRLNTPGKTAEFSYKREQYQTCLSIAERSQKSRK